MKEDQLITRQEAARMLRVSTRTIDRYIADQKISVVKDQGRSLLRSSEVELLQDMKNITVSQVVSPRWEKNNEIGPSAEEVFKYKFLYEDAKEQVQQRDEMIRHMHYRLGVLETENTNTIPLLEAQTTKQELEQSIASLSEENTMLKTHLQSAKTGRVIFFVIALLSFLAVFLALLIR